MPASVGANANSIQKLLRGYRAIVTVGRRALAAANNMRALSAMSRIGIRIHRLC
jgi:hypothetical protein